MAWFLFIKMNYPDVYEKEPVGVTLCVWVFALGCALLTI